MAASRRLGDRILRLRRVRLRCRGRRRRRGRDRLGDGVGIAVADGLLVGGLRVVRSVRVVGRVLLVRDALLGDSLVGRGNADGGLRLLHDDHVGAVVLDGARVQADLAVAVDDDGVCNQADEEEEAERGGGVLDVSVQLNEMGGRKGSC